MVKHTKKGKTSPKEIEVKQKGAKQEVEVKQKGSRSRTFILPPVGQKLKKEDVIGSQQTFKARTFVVPSSEKTRKSSSTQKKPKTHVIDKAAAKTYVIEKYTKMAQERPKISKTYIIEAYKKQFHSRTFIISAFKKSKNPQISSDSVQGDHTVSEN